MIPFIANTQKEIDDMLNLLGVKNIDGLFADVQPGQRCKSFHLPKGKSEFEVFEHFKNIAAKNISNVVPFIGGGFYDHYVPQAVSALTTRGEFYTAYTPYQPECSQGTLQALYEFQSMICALTQMDVSNASVYEGGTALYEACMMAIRITGRNKIIMDGGVSPIYRKIIQSYTINLNFKFEVTEVAHGQADRNKIKKLIDEDTAAVILQNPNFFGAIDDHSDIVEETHKKGALAIQSVYPLAMGILKTPGECGFDIATGEGQSLGLPLNFGGPYLGFLACKKEYVRKMPGRIVGATVDTKGRRCFVNTLQAREQHIRREKATSNICTNVALCALQAAVYMSLLGKEGFRELAKLNFDKSEYAKKQIDKIKGVEVKRSSPTFNEFAVFVKGKDTSKIVEAMIDKGFAAGFPLGRYYKGMDEYMIVAVTEKRTKKEIFDYAKALNEVLCN